MGLVLCFIPLPHSLYLSLAQFFFTPKGLILSRECMGPVVHSILCSPLPVSQRASEVVPPSIPPSGGYPFCHLLLVYSGQFGLRSAPICLQISPSSPPPTLVGVPLLRRPEIERDYCFFRGFSWSDLGGWVGRRLCCFFTIG